MNKIKPLKKEWPELYQYLTKGHLQIVTLNSGRITTIQSYQLYRYLIDNIIKIHKTPFLQDYDNVVSTFANDEDTIFFEYEINYSIKPIIVGDKCSTCNYPGPGLLFDKKTKKLLGKNGKINDINDWK